MNGMSFFKLSATKDLNCFSEKASSWPLKVKTIMFVVTSRFPLKETLTSEIFYDLIPPKLIYQM